MVKHIAMIFFGYQIQASFKSQFEKKVKVFTLKITADLLGHSKIIAIFYYPIHVIQKYICYLTIFVHFIICSTL